MTVTLLLAASAALRADDSPSVLLTLSTDRDAVCAGGVHSDVCQAHLVATVTDLEGQPLARQLVYFSADHKFVNVAPSFDLPVAITDAQGEARTVLTSGDYVTAGQVTARCGEAESAVTVAFEMPTGHFDFLWCDTPKPLQYGPCGGPRAIQAVFHETWRGQPVPHHELEFRFSAWLPGNTKSRDDQKNADCVYGADTPPYGSFAPIRGITDEDGVVVTWWRPGAAKLAWLIMDAFDWNVRPFGAN
jgi:hypothetical protein